MLLHYTEIDRSPLATQQLQYFAELEEQEGFIDVDDYEYQQSLYLNADCMYGRQAYNREFDL